MKVKSYESTTKKLLFVLIPYSAEVSNLPEDIKVKFGGFKLFKEYTIDQAQPYFGLDPKEAVSDIEKQGYHITQSKIEIKTNG